MLMEPRGDLWSLACLHPTGSPILEHWKTKHLPGFRQYGRRCNSWKHLPFTAAAARLSTDCWRKIVSMLIFIASRPVYWAAAFITLLQRRSNASSWRKLMTKLWLSYNNGTNNSSRIETRSSLRSRYGSLSFFWAASETVLQYGRDMAANRKKGIVHFSSPMSVVLYSCGIRRLLLCRWKNFLPADFPRTRMCMEIEHFGRQETNEALYGDLPRHGSVR